MEKKKFGVLTYNIALTMTSFTNFVLLFNQSFFLVTLHYHGMEIKYPRFCSNHLNVLRLVHFDGSNFENGKEKFDCWKLTGMAWLDLGA